MKIAHLKRSKKEIKERHEEMSKPMSHGEDEYPYGTRVSLENEHMDEVGIKKPKVGDTYEIRGHATVHSAEEREREGDGGKHRRVELQITHLGAAKKDMKSIRESLEDAAKDTKEYEDGAAKAKK